MIQYFLKKTALMGSVFFIVVSIVFFVAHMLPGDPVSLWVGEHPTKEQIKTILKEGYRKDILLSLDKLKSIN